MPWALQKKYRMASSHLGQMWSLVLFWPQAASVCFSTVECAQPHRVQEGLACWATFCAGYHNASCLFTRLTYSSPSPLSVSWNIQLRPNAHGAMQATAVSPFKHQSRSLSPSQRMNSTTSPSRHASPYRAASVKFQQQQQQQQISAARDVMPSLQQKLQADFERYRRTGQEKLSSTGRPSLSSTQRQKPSVYRSLQGSLGEGQEQGTTEQSGKYSYGMQHPAQVGDRGNGVSQRQLQSAQSVDRRSRLVHQRTVDVVPRLDSLGYGAPVKQMLPSARSTLGRRGQIGRASAPPWTAGGQSGRRISPSRFAEREQEPLLAPGLAESQRIGALH